PLHKRLKRLRVGGGEMVREGKDLVFLASGSMVPVAVEAATSLAERGVDCGVANLRFAKPLDRELLRRARAAAPRLLTLEEHLAMGGVGSAILEVFHEEGWDASNLRLHAIPDRFVEHSPPPVQRASFTLDPGGVAA